MRLKGTDMRKQLDDHLRQIMSQVEQPKNDQAAKTKTAPAYKLAK